MEVGKVLSLTKIVNLIIFKILGEAGSLDSIINKWEKRIISYRDYYKEEEKFGVDENRRMNASGNKAADKLFGVSGSFRQLNVD